METKTLNSTCCIFNLAPHYRAPIYTLMDQELNCDFYFGDHLDDYIKIMDVERLKGYKKTVRNVRVIFKKFWWQKGVTTLVFRKEYKNFILTGDTNIISNIIIALCSLILRKKVILWTHGFNRIPSWKGKILTYPLYYMANKYLLYSDYAKSIMLKNGFSDKKIICIYNSLDYEKQISLRNKISISNIYLEHFGNNYPTIIYIGRIQKVKKIDQLITAIRLLEKRNIFCNLMLVGENIDQINIETLLKENEISSKIWEYGPCYDESKISEFIYNSDVCVSPGNIGLTALHSLVYGTPAITHGNFEKQGPEFEAIEPGITGDFFTENDIRDLSQKIEKWLNLDLIQRQKVRLAAFSRIDEKYNPRYQLEIFKKVINEK